MLILKMISNADCDALISDSNAQIEKKSVNDEIKQMYREVFDGEEEKKKMDLSDTFEAQKGDHVLVKGQNRKLPALVGNKVNGDGEFVEVNFYTKMKDKGWKMLEVLHVIKIKEIERRIERPTLNYVSRTRAFLDFPDLTDLNCMESSDTSFDI